MAAWWHALAEQFAWPWMLAALPLPLLAWWWLPARKQEDAVQALRIPDAERRIQQVPATGRTTRPRGMALLPWLAWALLCVAAARPQSLGPASMPPQSGRDLMLAVDLSGSMEQPDMELGSRVVDRLTAAKAVISDFLDRRASDRVGLVLFGAQAYAVAPLTLDRESVREQLAQSEVGMAGRETAIGDAIGLAVKRLRSQTEGQRVLILLTDGVSNAGTLTPEKAAELAAIEGVRIYTIAFGGDGGSMMSVFGMRIPLPGMPDDVDEAGLRNIAKKTSGEFFRARDTTSLANIYAEIDRLEPIKHPGKPVRPRIEHYWQWLAAALFIAILALLSSALSSRRMKLR